MSTLSALNPMWKINLLLVFSLLTSHRAICQSPYFHIEIIRYDADGKELRFPIISNSTANRLTVEKINQNLQLSELELLNGFQANTIFEKIMINDSTIYGGKTDMTDSIYTNNNRMLSIGFDEASSGMTTAYWTKYYNFNSGNGDLIHLSDLFTSNGYNFFLKLVIKKSIRKFRLQLKENNEPDSTWSEIISSLGRLDLDDFYIKGNSILIDGDDLLSKPQKGYGLDMLVKFDLIEFKKYLNDYGKCVFNLSNDAIAKYRSKGLPQLFAGNLGDQPILLIIRPIYADSYDGIYCFQKGGKGIDLDGTIRNGVLNFDESKDFNGNYAHITGKFKHDSIIAIWTKAKTTKRIRLYAYRK